MESAGTREREGETRARTETRSLDVRFGGVRAADQDKYENPRKQNHKGGNPLVESPPVRNNKKRTAQNPSSPSMVHGERDGRGRQRREEDQQMKNQSTRKS